jgi:hypothetical protein
MTRVKIKKIPKMEVGGSYLERTPGYTDTRFTYFGNKTTSPPKDEGATNGTVGPVDRDVAEYEAEKGEVLFRNSNPDETGKSRNGGLFKITGKKHEQGGTPLIGKEGDFIISDNPDLHIPIDHQKEMQLKTSSKKDKKQNTPAKVLLRNVDPKEYNKHLSTLMDPNKDEISKNTASVSLEQFNKVIQKVANYQEATKSGKQTHVPANTTAAEEQQQFGNKKQPIVKKQEQNTPVKRNGGYSLRKADKGMFYDEAPAANEPVANTVVIPQVAPGQYTLPGSEWSSNAPDKVVNPYALNVNPGRSALQGFGSMPTYQQSISNMNAPVRNTPDPRYRFIPTDPSQEVPEDISNGVEMPPPPSKQGVIFDPKTDSGYPIASDVFAGIDQGRTPQRLDLLNRTLPTAASRANQVLATRPFGTTQPFAEEQGVFNPMDWWSQNSSTYNPNIPQPDLYTISQDGDPSSLGNSPLPTPTLPQGDSHYAVNIPQPDLYRIAPDGDPSALGTAPLPGQQTPPAITPEMIAAAQNQQAPLKAAMIAQNTNQQGTAGTTSTNTNTTPGTTSPATTTTTTTPATSTGNTPAATTVDNGLHAGDADYINIDKYNYPDLRDESNVGNLQALKTMMLLNNANKRYLTPANQYVHTDLKQREYDPSEAIKQAKQQGTLNREMLSRYANPQQAALALSQSQTADQLARINADAQAKNVALSNQNAAMNWEDANAIARKNIDTKLQNQMMNNRVLANSQNQMTKLLTDQVTYQQLYNQQRDKANALNRIEQTPYGAVAKDPITGKTTMEFPFLANGKFNPRYPGGWDTYAVKQQQLAKSNSLGLPTDDQLQNEYNFSPEEIKNLKHDAIIAYVTKSKKKKTSDDD